MPGGSFDHLTKSENEKNSTSKKIEKKLSTTKLSSTETRNEKAQPGKLKSNSDSSSSKQLNPTTNENGNKPKSQQNTTIKKSLNFLKTCSSSNSLSPSKLPPPPSPPNVSSIKLNSKIDDDIYEKINENCEMYEIDQNKRKTSLNSLKGRKSSTSTNKSTPDAACSICSSGEVNEIILKIKSCQNCSNVAIDQINYSGKTMFLSNDIISSLTGQNSVNCGNLHQSQQQQQVSAVQQCYHHLTNITQRFRNMYKSQIHTSHSQSSSQRSSIVTIPEQDIPIEFTKSAHKDEKQHCNPIKHFNFSIRKTSTANSNQPQITKKQSSNSIQLNSPDSSKPNISSILNNAINSTKFKKMQNIENSSKNNVNGDVLVLKICDLDHSSNLSSSKNDGKMATKLNSSTDSKQHYHEKTSNIYTSNKNNEISFIKKDCQHGNFNFVHHHQSSVDVTTSPSLCSPAQEVTVFNLSPDEIKVEKISTPAPIIISPTYFSDNNSNKLKISLNRNESQNSVDAGSSLSDSGKISPSQLKFPKTLSTKYNFDRKSTKQHQLQKLPSGTSYQSKLNKTKISRKTHSLQNEDIPTTDKAKITISKSYRKIMVMSEYNKKDKIKTKPNLNQRRSLMKKSKQHNAEISKSLDILLPSDILNDFSDLPDSFFNLPPYTLTSKSTSNLNAIFNDYDDDDEGPFEHINSVELIFISDEFLNRAVKHDLKIINCSTDLNEKIKSPIEIKVSKPNFSSTTSSSSNIGSTKGKLLKKSSSIESKTIKTPDSVSVSGGSSRKNSISPSRPDKPLITKNLSDLNIGSKKLIVISEDFKRKSLENTVIIINQNDDDSIIPPQLLYQQQQQQQKQQQQQEIILKNQQSNSNSKDRSPSTDNNNIKCEHNLNDGANANQIKSSNSKTAATKRKNLKDLKSWGRESSVDDVGNQMVSHAFCSAEEPDELCLENKEIVETPK